MPEQILTAPEYEKRLNGMVGAIRGICQMGIEMVDKAARLKESDPKKAVAYEQDMRHLYKVQNSLNDLSNMMAYRVRFQRWPN